MSIHYQKTPEWLIKMHEQKKKKKNENVRTNCLLKQEIDGKKATIYPTFNEIL